MDLSLALVIAAGMLAAALLYSSVGHGGGSGYLAVMALFGVSPLVMKPTALVLNIIVASLATFRFHRAGHFSWSLFWPFAAASIPAAYVGGAVTLPGDAYRILAGLILIYAAVRLALSARVHVEALTRPPQLFIALPFGLLIGLASGLVGVGGGIFLSPLLLLAHWATPHPTAAVSAVFILVNSIAGLLGHFASTASLPDPLPLWAGVVALGGWIGATYGSRRMPPFRLRQALALVLALAGLKFMLV